MNSAKILIAIMLLVGCSTLQNRGSQTVVISPKNDSGPIKIEVENSDGSYATTIPNTVVGRSSWTGIQIRVVDPCYERVEQAVPRSIARSFWANLFFIYGFIVDPITGAFWDYDNRVELVVQKKPRC